MWRGTATSEDSRALSYKAELSLTEAAGPLLGVSSKDVNFCPHPESCARTFTAALFIVAPHGSQQGVLWAGGHAVLHADGASTQP